MILRIIICCLSIFLLIKCANKNDLLYSSTIENEGLFLLNDSTLSSQKLLQDSALILSILHSNMHNDIKTLKTKTKVYVQVKDEKNKNKKISFSMETRILKDSIFWCSMTYFGIEIVRIKATKNIFLVKIIGENNSFHLYQFLEKQYDSVLALIKKRGAQKNQDISTEIDNLSNMKSMLDYIKNNQQEIFMFMNLCFMGNFPFQKVVSDSIWYNEITQQYTINYPFQKGKLTALFNKNISTYLLNKFFMKQGKMYFGVNYLEYENLENNNFLPKKFIVFNDIVNNKNEHQILQLIFQNNTIESNIPLDFPMLNTTEK